MITCRAALTLLALVVIMVSSASADGQLDALKENQQVADFRVEYVYNNGDGAILGARFRHAPTDMVLDFMRIQSVPQAYMWVNSPPPTDGGEPHTCEHLLLGKGNKGRFVASLEDMSLGSSSASTYRLFTNYHYHTTAGGEVFFDLFKAKLDALLHPNYSDEEIRREMANMGVVEDPETGELTLEEKGTVYAEMVSSFERSGSRIWTEMLRELYGEGHPIANVSGGTPDAIRERTAEDLRKFHENTYQLSNMGIIVSLPSEYALDETLAKLSGILKVIDPDATKSEDPATFDDRLPVPNPVKTESVRYVEYPHQNENEPGQLVIAWPPELEIDKKDELVLDLFISNFASGQTSNLYKKLIDTQSREVDIGANSIWCGVGYDLGKPVYMWFDNVRRDAMNEETIGEVRDVIRKELETIAGYADGSPELVAFNDRIRNKILEERRFIRKFLSTPPRFGYRGTGNSWMDHLKSVQKTDGFSRDLTLSSDYDYVENLLDGNRNIWRDQIAKFKLLDSEPSVLAAVANPKILEKDERARDDRIRAFVNTIKQAYEVDTDKEAIDRYKSDYDKNTEIIAEKAREIQMPSFVDSPPMTLDDQLDYSVEKLPGGGPNVVSKFGSMTGASFGLAFDLYAVPKDLLVYVPALPTLIDEVGVIRNGKPVSYYDMREQIRQEILYVYSNLSRNFSSERAELQFGAAGSDEEESQKAVEWLKLKLHHPDWRPENLPRIRDAVDTRLTNLRNRMKGSEESWVSDPALSYWKQTNPLLMSTGCFLTQAHSVFRVKWLLNDPGTEADFKAFSDFVGLLKGAGTGIGESELAGFLQSVTSEKEDAAMSSGAIRAKYTALPEHAKTLAADAVYDLIQTLNEIPESSLQQDWPYVCDQIVSDLAVKPEKALADLDKLMRAVRKQSNVRSFVSSNETVQKSIMPMLYDVISGLSSEKGIKNAYTSAPLIKNRLKARDPRAVNPVYVGLVNENSSSGVFVNSARCAGFLDHDDETLLDFLAARLYGGGGAHSMFMKTWGAGLAYSNGLRSNEFTGRLTYYAERCPDLTQTMSFVVNELVNAPVDESLADYALAQAFQASRSGSNYESRGEGIASDLADGLTPSSVRKFREGVLKLRKDPKIYEKLHERMLEVYGRVLPGLDPKGAQVDDAVYFILGPEKQFESFEEYLDNTEGDQNVYRLYPRDFWITGNAGS